MCQRLDSESIPAAGLKSACGIYYNSTEDLACFDIYNEYLYCADPTGCGLGHDSKAWDYQVKAERSILYNYYCYINEKSLQISFQCIAIFKSYNNRFKLLEKLYFQM